MDTLNGIKLEKHDLKMDGGQYLYFKQLLEKDPALKSALTENLFDKYEYLLVKTDNDLMGVKDEEQHKIANVPEAYTLAQDMFVGG